MNLNEMLEVLETEENNGTDLEEETGFTAAEWREIAEDTSKLPSSRQTELFQILSRIVKEVCRHG